MDRINFGGETFFLDFNEIHNYLLEKEIIITMMDSNNSNMKKKFDIINNAYLILLDIENKLDNHDVLESEYKFLENCCDELISRKIVDIASKNNDLDVKKKKLIKLLDEVNSIRLLYPNLAKYLDTDVLKITNVIDDTIIYKLIAI